VSAEARLKTPISAESPGSRLGVDLGRERRSSAPWAMPVTSQVTGTASARPGQWL